MPRPRAALLAVALLLTSFASVSPTAGATFTDTAASPFSAEINWLAARGITGGCDTRRYCPTQPVTRGQMASFLARMFMLPAASRDYFGDDNGSVHESAINRLAAAGVTGGCQVNKYCPDARLTRAQMASLLARVNRLTAGTGTNYFYDDNGMSHEPNIDRVARAGISAGCGTGRFCPSASVTRGEMAAFLYRIVKPIQPPTPFAFAPARVAGVVGYGAGTSGGAGGKVIAVTNLNDSGAGSLRAALAASGPRTVVFHVGGTIRLQSDLRIVNPFVTVDGSTAPSPLAIRDGMMRVLAHDVVLRHLRFRPGDQVSSPDDVDAVSINGLSNEVYNVVLDHVTMLWGPDIGGLAILGNVHDVTVQYSIMGEGLYLSRHAEATPAEGGHSHATNVTQLDGGTMWPRRITFVRNLFTTADTRIPRLQGAECVDIVNNVIYNWGRLAASGNPRSVNLVNNWYRSGPESVSDAFWHTQTSAVVPDVFRGSVYESGNRADGYVGRRGGMDSVFAASARCGGLSVQAASPEAAYSDVLAGAGALSPVRDAVDQRVISDVIRRAGTFFNGVGLGGRTPYWPY